MVRSDRLGTTQSRDHISSVVPDLLWDVKYVLNLLDVLAHV